MRAVIIFESFTFVPNHFLVAFGERRQNLTLLVLVPFAVKVAFLVNFDRIVQFLLVDNLLAEGIVLPPVSK